MIYPKGTIHACAVCGAHLYIFKRDIRSGDHALVDDVEPIAPQPRPESGKPSKCVHCKQNHGFTKLIVAGDAR